MGAKFTVQVQCTAWRPLPAPKGTLLGFASIRVAEAGVTFLDVALHRKNNAVWMATPARPWVEAGELVRNDAGKIQRSYCVPC
jgi:hypothetical protein